MIKVYCDYEVIATLERVYKFGNLGKFRFCDVNLDDLENVYKFLKSKKLKFKKLWRGQYGSWNESSCNRWANW